MWTETGSKKRRNSLVVLLLAALSQVASSQQQVSVNAVIEKAAVFVGEDFMFQIRIDGSDNVADPQLPETNDFQITPLGGRSNTSTSIVVVNGKTTQTVHKAYIIPYRLVPQKTGNLTIPAFVVIVDGQTYATQPLTVRVKEPEEIESFKLRISLAKRRCYVGEPIAFTVSWYVGLNVSDFAFSVPVFENSTLAVFVDPAVVPDNSKEYIQFPLDKSPGAPLITAEKRRGTLEGTTYTLVEFTRMMIPKEPGTHTIPKAVVALDAVASSEDDDLISSFFRQRTYQRFVVPSNALTLTVLELPQVGKPDNFQGHIGEYRLTVSASPAEVRVGDPITITMTLAGGSYIEDALPPSLDQQRELRDDFKIPEEMSRGRIVGRTKVFTQTVRALHDDIKEIPSIELPFFNPELGRYEVARSDPIPIAVQPTRVVTFEDVEGVEAASTPQREIESSMSGIAFNYEDLGALRDERYGLATLVVRPAWTVMVCLPLLLFLGSLAGRKIVRKDPRDKRARETRAAHRALSRLLSGNAEQITDPRQFLDELLAKLKEYLANQFDLPAGALTYRDVAPLLHSQGVSSPALSQLEQAFDICEAGRYAGQTVDTSVVQKVVEMIGGVAAEAQQLDRGRKRQRT